MSNPDNPFKGPRYHDKETYFVDAGDRICLVKSFDRAQCLAALEVPRLQKTVENAVRARLRYLDKINGG